MTCNFISKKQEGKVYLSPSLKESILFNKIVNITGVDNFDKALEIYSVTNTEEFKKHNLSVIKQYRDFKSVIKQAVPSKAGFSEVFSEDGAVKIVFKENAKSVDLELIESTNKGGGLARKFLQDFIYSYPNKDISLTVSPRDSSTTFQGLARFYQSLGFEFKAGSSFEMVRYYNKGRLYPEGYDVNAEPSVEHLMNFINGTGTTTTTKKQVVQFLKDTGISNTDELLTKLSLAENQGIFLFDKKSLEKTKLFSTFEVSKILKDVKKQKSISDLLKYLRQKDYIEIDLVEVEGTDSISAEGKIERVSVKSETEVKDLDLKPKGKRVVKVASEVTGTTIVNEKLAEAISYIKLVKAEDWLFLQNQIKTLLTEVETEGSENGINLNGLRDSFSNLTQDQVLSVLNAVEDVLEDNISPSQLDLILDKYLSSDIEYSNIKVNEDEIILAQEISEEEAYENYSLLKIGANIYKKVEKQTYLDLLKVNSIKTVRSIEEVEQDVNKHYDRLLPVELAKTLYLLRSNLDVSILNRPVNTLKITNFKEEVASDFVDTFSKWLIDNNNSYFKVDAQGIYFEDDSNSMEAMESLPEYLRYELNNYSVSSSTITTPDILQRPSVETGLISSEREALEMNPKSIPLHKGMFLETGTGMIVVTDTESNFLNINGIVYELNSVAGNVSFYNILNETKAEASNTVLDFTYLKTESKPNTNSNLLSEERLEEINKEHYNC